MTWYSIGQRRVDAAIQSGQILSELLALANGRSTLSGVQELSGGLSRAVEIWAIARTRGWPFPTGKKRQETAADKFLSQSGAGIARNLNHSFAAGDVKAIQLQLGALAGAIDGLRRLGLLHFETRQPAREPDKPAAPLKVEIVALPPRTRKTRIERDEFGEIANTVQIEVDG